MVDIARFDVIHKTLYEQALKDVQLLDLYSHTTVLAAVGYEPRSVSPNWARVRDAVYITVGEEMMPLANLFFQVHLAKKHGFTPASHPEKFVALGQGKTAAGYGLVRAMPAEMVMVWTGQTEAVARGVLTKHKDAYEAAVNGGKAIGGVHSPQQIASDYISEEDLFG